MRASAVRRAANFTLANGAQMPKLGLGTWKMTKEQATPAVSHALKVGYRHIDCAWAYRNEDAVGAAIAKSGVPRQQLWLTSKLWNSFHDPENVEKCLDATLKDLGTDYLDLWEMHWPVAFLNSNGSQIPSVRSTGGAPIEQPELSRDFMVTYRVMEEMVKKGKVRNLGVSNFNIRRTGQVVDEASIKPIVNQVEVNWGVHNEELRNYAHAHDVRLQAYSPFGSNQNAEKYLSDPIVVDVARRNNMTPAQVLLAWQLGRDIIPIAKSVTPARIEENFKVMELELPADDVQHLTYEAQSKPIERTVDPTQGWDVAEEIFEDGVDQTREMELKGDAYVPPPAAESPAEYRLEPRNAQSYHTMTSSLSSTRRTTALQDALARRSHFGRGFASSSRSAAVAEAAPTAASEGPVAGASNPLLRTTPEAALQTPGLAFADGEEGIQRETKKTNMCTVRTSTPPAKPRRQHTTRKTFLFEQYASLLRESHLAVVLQHNNLTVAEMTKLRREIASIKLPEGETKRARLTIVRSGLMKAVCRRQTQQAMKSIEPLFSGPIALLTCPHLSPAYVSSLLNVVDRALGHTPPKAPARGAAFPTAAVANPRMVPLAAVLETNRLMEMPAVREVGRLGTLSQLRGQIVGLLSAPGQQLAGVLSQAAGGNLALTLDAHKRALEEQSSPSSSSSA
ncbi:uncharacterized protein PFL1_03905 [Pseudozyma flocculosa PF-1]|uniref:Related to GCY1 - galactose-induced protein of aldo/keto reductase family n=2 Tax=Pseudozyma flocculosa TaxID=84751 RepID=A0A5C3EWA4_9BASI|nr:uncharacterized protein PFL1_03905 [Pseudozyma flocculosa PF-1]EPQ28602.1 hypothetical protein PFL1_03905 [Pseudozyma flocculosa PF-1]SPO36544.1 related to GCY1 - galactose-induced protein of aldo/keto reductase family [Pseudozyma flocculosa]